MSFKKIFRCDLGKENYSQLNNKINPSNTCNSTSMVMALDYMGYKFPDNIFPEYEQPEDKLTMLCYTDEEVKEFYKKLSAPMYNQWIAEMDKIKNETPDLPLKDYRFIDSYPPNEVHAVLSFATNKFVGKEDATYFKEKSSVQEIVKELTENKPVVVSVKFGDLNHVLTLTGVEIETENEGESWTPTRFFADDTFGKFNIKTKEYDKTVSGNNSEFAVDELVPCLKAINSMNKYAHYFNFPTAVV